MSAHAWVHEFPSAVTVCDTSGIILEMNLRSQRAFAAEGGEALIGTNVLDCHPEPARALLMDLLREGRAHVYTIEKHGVKKLIAQSPWYSDGSYAGLVEISIELPAEMPHFIRA